MSIISQNNKKEIVKTAQEYIINKGWAVIPGVINLNNKGKKELDLKSDYWNKTDEKGLDDPTLVEEVFKNKNAIGIVTGYRSGITVLDIDTEKDKSKPNYGKTYVSLDSFPETYTVKTQSGGYHLYYKYYSGIANKADIGGDKYKKLDCRNDGGFVFAPPTEIEGKQVYEIIKNIEPQPFPVDYFENIKSSKKQVSQFQGIKAIKEFKGMTEGERDTALFTFAEHGYRVSQKKDWPHVDLSVQLMNGQMKQPLSDSQVSKIINSAKKYNNTTEKKLDLITDKKGNPTLELKNVVTILREDETFSNRIRANTFSGTIEYNKNNKWDIIKKSDETILRVELADKYPFMGKMPKQHVEDAIALIATDNQISPPAEYLKSLKWDKKERLNKWIPIVYGVQDNAYYRELGHHYIVGLVNRVVRPGCQMDNAIVLDGVEGFGKSQSLRALCNFGDLGTLFNETSENPDGKDFAISLLGNVITEFAEGAVFDYRDRKKVKSFISKTTDKYRPPYERASLDFPRQSVFAMSTNDSQYLEDRGINRRWWPIVISRIDPNKRANIKWLDENIKQMYAEAMEKINDNYWDFSKEANDILIILREDKKIEDETYAPIYEWYLGLEEEKRNEGITKMNGWQLLNNKKDASDFELKKIGEFYTEILYLKQVRRKVNGYTKRVFIPTERTPGVVEELVEKTKLLEF